MEYLKTPLFHEHEILKAQLAPFGEWIMPIQYSGILSEHRQCREKASLFDICHMGELYFNGDIEKSGIENALSFSISKIRIGKCKYGFLLNENGGIIDDLIIYRYSDNEVMIVVNSATIEKDFKILKSFIKKDAEFENISGITAKLDIQGPLSRDILKEKFGNEISEYPLFWS